MTEPTGSSRPAAPVSRRKAAAGTRTSRRLGVDDWTEAALDLLLSEGVGAVTIARLCERLGVTKGSFYWHFDGLDQLLETTARYWCADRNDVLRGVAGLGDLRPEARLARMAELLTGTRIWQVELAVRDWARANETVAEAVRALDLRILQTLTDALIELGFTADQAGMRAGLMCYTGIGFVHGNQYLPMPTEAQRREFFEFLTRK